MVSGRLFGLNEKILKVNRGCLGLSEIVRYFVEMPEQVTVTRQIQFDVDEVNPIYDEIVKLLEKRSIKKDI